MTDPEAGAAEVGYRIVLPPGWARIPLRSGTAEAIEAVLNAVAPEPSSVPADRRTDAAEAIRKAAAAARDGNGVDLYLPVVARYGRPMAESFVVAEVAFGSLDPLDPAVLLARRAAAPDTERLILDGVVCSRTESGHPADPARGAAAASRRVGYVLPVPDEPDRWILITFSALEDDLTSDLIQLFNAVIATFRWTRTTPV
ncbi:MAG TPA: hypothetical protein VHU88_21985 [Sporichthyaceae bacterium]|nr:hypothetical protein [Sporichthyaceae bacterium]